MSIFVRAALLGFATGGRSTFGLALLALTAPDSGSRLTSPWTRRLTALAALGEGVGDKLPQTPSRLQLPGLLPRIGLGGLTAAILAHREGRSRPVSALAGLIGAGSAVAGAQLGVRWRSRCADRLGRDWPGAVLEDATDLAVATVACRAL
jgi:uncharacterized membrane protein